MENVEIIKTENDYRQALAQFDELVDAEPGSADAAERDRLAVLIDNYELRHPSHDIWFKNPNRGEV